MIIFIIIYWMAVYTLTDYIHQLTRVCPNAKKERHVSGAPTATTQRAMLKRGCLTWGLFIRHGEGTEAMHH